MRDIFIFLGGAMFGSVVAFFTLCLLAGIRQKDDGKKENNEGE